MKIIEQMGRDPMVSSVLVLYGLHPDDLETRVREPSSELEPKLRRDRRCALSCSASRTAQCAIRVTPGGHACGSTRKAFRRQVEDAMYEAAPDIASLLVEGSGRANRRTDLSRWKN